MWFQIELPRPAMVTEVQFESAAPNGGRGGAGRGTAAPLPAPGAAPVETAGAPGPPAAGGFGGRGAVSPALVAYPRAYSVQLSMDGKKWSKPVATGRGEGPHTSIAFPPAEAKFIRITQTDNIPEAPWSIRNLRVYEAHTAAGTK